MEEGNESVHVKEVRLIVRLIHNDMVQMGDVEGLLLALQ